MKVIKKNLLIDHPYQRWMKLKRNQNFNSGQTSSIISKNKSSNNLYKLKTEIRQIL